MVWKSRLSVRTLPGEAQSPPCVKGGAPRSESKSNNCQWQLHNVVSVARTSPASARRMRAYGRLFAVRDSRTSAFFRVLRYLFPTKNAGLGNFQSLRFPITDSSLPSWRPWPSPWLPEPSWPLPWRSRTPQYGKLPFVIPSSWEWVKLSGIAKSNIGLTYRPTDIVSTGVPVYRSNNIRNGKIDTTDLVKVSTKILEKQLLHVGDLLICARNGSRNLIGKNAIISELKEPTSFGAFMAVCRSAYNQWIRIVLNSEYFDRYLDDSNSATINQVTQKMLLALPIPLPPHQEQHRIVAKIEELFAQLDKIEASL